MLTKWCFVRGNTLEQALEQLESETDEHVQAFIQTLKQSTRGVVR